MKLFLSLQAVLIAITVILCFHAKSLTDNVGITEMNSIEKIHQSDCDYIAVIHDTEELDDRFTQFDRENADLGTQTYGTAIFIGTPKDSFSFSNSSTFCTIDVDKVIKGNIKTKSINVEIKGGFYYETESEHMERLSDAKDMEIETPAERLFTFDLGGMNFMNPGKKYLIISQTLDLGDKTFYRINGYMISWLCLDKTESKIMKTEYVYSDCFDNEIFTPEQEIIEAFYSKKESILNKYCK
ncbi:hypothetical protein [Ruminococcus albus]|uniref:Uncharacterized protein n=1 Tax=Ruminococcus albus (strain ATCC 27210 / DSM 20455 / JCM 14654 / NCDO 2250 / 7) TaxID=697329 RepID=E6UJZ2_RUMA7|nr:hypothetical protein [Ruminococcus albus]ADU23988.1 hypothetical protein Rumal_3546 [Ruminococcus albus 7 = DSM 20455]